MRIAAVIELDDCTDSALPVDLIEAAYLASLTAPVMFVLPSPARHAVDRALDPVVSRLGLASRGIRYVLPSDETIIQSALTGARLVVATSPGFRARCDAMSIPVVPTSVAVDRLLSEEKPTPFIGVPAPQTHGSQLAFGD